MALHGRALPVGDRRHAALHGRWSQRNVKGRFHQIQRSFVYPCCALSHRPKTSFDRTRFLSVANVRCRETLKNLVVHSRAPKFKVTTGRK